MCMYYLKAGIVLLTCIGVHVVPECSGSDEDSYLNYQNHKNKAMTHLFMGQYDSCAVSFNRAFQEHTPKLFDQYHCAICLVNAGSISQALVKIEAIVRKGYPVELLLSNSSFSPLLKDSLFHEKLNSVFSNDLTVPFIKLNTELKDRVLLDSEVRQKCITPNCDEWKSVTQDNVDFLINYIEQNGLPCDSEIGFGLMYFNLILLHGKSASNFFLLNDEIKNMVLEGCFPAENYAYWMDGNQINIFNSGEIYGTISLQEYRNTRKLPCTSRVKFFDLNRRQIGLPSFQTEVDRINQVK